MKFPFDFNVTLVFRLVLPGLVLAIALTPLMDGLATLLGQKFAPATALPIAAIVLGWLVVLLDSPIYMAFEGRRFWPSRLRALGHRNEKARLARILAQEAKGGDGAIEWSLKTLDFPLSKNGEREAVYPTRLGNLLAAFERYPTIVYGIDGVFFWYRIWPQLDKDLRAEIDQAQAIADSGLYVSACLVASGLIGPVYLVMQLPRIGDYPAVTLPLLPSQQILIIFSMAAFAGAYLTYRVSLFSQRTYGEMFRALFDVYRDKLDFVDDVVKIAKAKGADDPGAEKKEQYMTAWRFLRWYKVRKSGADQNEKPN